MNPQWQHIASSYPVAFERFLSCLPIACAASPLRPIDKDSASIDFFEKELLKLHCRGECFVEHVLMVVEHSSSLTDVHFVRVPVAVVGSAFVYVGLSGSLLYACQPD